MTLHLKSILEFEMLDKIGEGTFGIVFKARDRRTGEIVAMKKLKIRDKESSEINILARLRHPSIVELKHVVASWSWSGSSVMAMEYVENDVRSVLRTTKQQGFSQSEAKCLMQQLLQGVGYIHCNKVLHRDLKTSNLLLNNRGDLKICDFGLACSFNNNDSIAHIGKVGTLWYRAPELLLGAKDYSTAVDMWSVGCIMAELLSGQLLFDGDKEIHQLGKIFKILGIPNEAIWPGFSELHGAKMMSNIKRRRRRRRRRRRSGSKRRLLRERLPTVSNVRFDLLSSLLAYDPMTRITAEEALNHMWFRQHPLPKSINI